MTHRGDDSAAGDADDWRRSVGQSATASGAWQRSVVQTGHHISHISDVVFGAPAGAYREQYVEDAELGVGIALRKYKTSMGLYWLLQVLAIIAGTCVVVLANTDVSRWSLALLGALAAGTQTAIAAANLQERAVVSGLLADRMGRELRDFHGRFGSYATGDALATLHDRIEKIRTDASTARFRLDRAKPDHYLPPVAEGRVGSTATGQPESL